MQPELDIDPVTLQTFGIMFALGFAAAGMLVGRRFQELGKPVDWAYELIFAGPVNLVARVQLPAGLLPPSSTPTGPPQLRQ